MKKNLLFLSSAALLSLGVATIGTTAQAAPPTVTTTLTPSTNMNPTAPIEIPVEGITGNTGALTLDVATPLKFGTNEITSKTQTLKAIPGTETITNKEYQLGVQVTDTRGTGAGWKLDVALSAFAGKIGGNVLKGAVLTLPIGTLSTSNGVVEVLTTPTSNSVELIPGEAGNKTAFSAAKNQGLGTWFSKFDKTLTTLEVPAGNYADEYSAELTWTLSNTI